MKVAAGIINLTKTFGKRGVLLFVHHHHNGCGGGGEQHCFAWAPSLASS